MKTTWSFSTIFIENMAHILHIFLTSTHKQTQSSSCKKLGHIFYNSTNNMNPKHETFLKVM